MKQYICKGIGTHTDFAPDLYSFFILLYESMLLNICKHEKTSKVIGTHTDFTPDSHSFLYCCYKTLLLNIIIKQYYKILYCKTVL